MTRLLLAFSFVGLAIGSVAAQTSAATAAANIRRAAPTPEQAIDSNNAAENAIPAETFLIHFGGNNTRFGVKNHAAAALTAYAVVGGLTSGRAWLHIEDFRLKQEEPLPNGKSRLFEQSWNDYIFPRGLHIVAAVFEDGSAKGDRRIIDRIAARRSEQLFTLSAMSNAVCSMVHRNETPTDMLADLAAQKSQYVHTIAGDRYISSGGEDAYIAMTRDLGKPGALNPVSTTLSKADSLAAKIRLEPVRDAAGKLYLADAPELRSCSLQ